MTRTLVLGGARSGKSAHAERLAAQAGKEVIYIATAGAGDGEMAQRIALHRAQRPAHWTTVEEKLALPQALATWRAPHRVVLVDCLTLWLSNLLFDGGADYPDVGAIELPSRFHAERTALLAELTQPRGDVIFVANEVGMGIVPYGAITRAYADEAGRLNQAVAALCDRAVFVAAGLPLVLKGEPC
ncbi:bifunctional adenosylcobinamide kinase/adenosylcobinamide-phosphate guanylyltransferase [Pseudoduganella chitinolytica]|uniref:Bifunctional adenosylcobalamin biosynthesis protein n=1 Tax=Pseudoduganella chitinolytica TaxID=34070 RepID=A0ABY8BBE1_9BURK|nr:bifunctional adenosylcobinamide kinase/adenosylcobinamide-phosphate guanylyltransferase [Pseudoduganella chitinolytica]WEF32753.1 bifunctional adenosylcobinamide kinase/adenosylcobinamide-phosphate guanylyltransferase [Pseudoduganella chitinolytica]